MSTLRLTIVKHENGDMEITDGERTTKQLMLGEILEMVVGLLQVTPPPYPMKTPSEWKSLYPSTKMPGETK